MSAGFEELVRDSMEWFTAEVAVPADVAGKARRHHRRRRLVQRAAIAAGAAVVVAAVVITATGGRAAEHSGVRTAAYVVRRVEKALVGEKLVMRETRSLIAPGGADFFDGRLSYQAVTWSYRGHTSTETFGARGQLRADAGTGIIHGKLRVIQVDYLLRQWKLIPESFVSRPANPCMPRGFLEAASGSFSTDWPSLIRRSLACGVYKVVGYAEIHGSRALKITGSLVLDERTPSDDNRTAVTLFVNPATDLPVRLSVVFGPASGRGTHSSQTSADFLWLPATAANVSHALVTIPAGYRHIAG
jgi:hypothetical protein